MNKTELVYAVAETAKTTKKAAAATVEAVLEEITAAMARGEKVQILGFGSFETRKRAARAGKNPRTGENVEIPAAIVPAFKPGKTLKDLVNE